MQAVDQLSNRSKTEEKAVKEENSRKLLQYREACASLVEGLTSSCSIGCQHALVGLISTVEGERLMDCTCQNPGCSMEKKRVEPCREEVTGHLDDTNHPFSSVQKHGFDKNGTGNRTKYRHTLHSSSSMYVLFIPQFG